MDDETTLKDYLQDNERHSSNNTVVFKAGEQVNSRGDVYYVPIRQVLISGVVHLCMAPLRDIRVRDGELNEENFVHRPLRQHEKDRVAAAYS